MARRLLVTGASGFLGAEVCAQAVRLGWEVVGAYRTHPPAAEIPTATLDVRDAAAVTALIALTGPDAIVHTAYMQDGDEAWATNVDGSAHVAAGARAVGARLVHLSSDVVFAGEEGAGPLREDHPLAPVNAYGASKAEAERVVAEAHPAAAIVRTSLIYGGPDHVPSKHEELAVAAARGEVDWTFFDDELRNPVAVADLAAALLELCEAEHAGPLHVAGPETIDRYAFACVCAQAAGEPVNRLRSAPAPAGRPKNLTLDTSRAQAVLGTRLRGVREVLARDLPR